MMNEIIPQNRFKDYTGLKCWQGFIRDSNLKTDIQDVKEKLNITDTDIQSLSVKDFDFEYIDKEEKSKCLDVKLFIEKHEWLGKLPIRPTHRFAAYYKGYLAGVIVMATPNAFSALLGKENRFMEKLISRGACISWSPKNLGSALIMFSIRWMVKNTHYRLFTAYSDVEAKELGTIYQACNFYYLGKKSGSSKVYFDNKRPHLGWFSDRNFRLRSYYKFYLRELNIPIEKDWFTGDKVNWNVIPEHVVKRMKDFTKKYQASCYERVVPPKHKYAYVLGCNKKETKRLRLMFKENVILYNYPKNRGQ